MGIISKLFGKEKSTFNINILEKNASLVGINEEFINSVRKSLLKIETKYGPFAFVAIEQDRKDENKYSLIVSAEWVKDNAKSAAIIGDKVYDNLKADLKPLLAGVSAVFLEKIPQMIKGKEKDLHTFAKVPELRHNYRYEYGNTLSILAYNPQAFKNFSNLEENTKSTKEYSNKIKKCLNCDAELASDQLKCTKCGSTHFIWEEQKN